MALVVRTVAAARMVESRQYYRFADNSVVVDSAVLGLTAVAEACLVVESWLVLLPNRLLPFVVWHSRPTKNPARFLGIGRGTIG